MPPMGCTPKYYPSVAFLPSVALGTLLTTNWVVVLIKVYISRRFNQNCIMFREFKESKEFRVWVALYTYSLPNFLKLLKLITPTKLPPLP